MGTSVIPVGSSQESILLDESLFREIQKHVDINNLPILEGEELERKYSSGRVEDLNQQYSVNPVDDIPYNRIVQAETVFAIPLPIREEFPGQYNFELLHGQGATKNCVYSQVLRKFFIDMEQTLPLKFKWDPPIEGLWLRATLIYASDQYISDPVLRCHNHMATSGTANNSVSPHVLPHVVRCHNMHSVYEEAHGHRSVIVPLGTPQPGSRYIPLGFQIMCKNSCSSGMNRRATELIFTLETMNRQVLGRRILSVRVCSCPKRDKDKEELEFAHGPIKNPGKKRKRVPRQPIHCPPGKKPMVTHVVAGHDSREYNISIKVPGRDNARAILNYAFDRLAGDALKSGEFQIIGAYLEELQKKLSQVK